jgi:preprotein translocase subunit SecG
MTATLLVIHILLAVALIIVILLQRTSADGGGLVGGGGSSSMGGLMSVRGTANLLTRITSIVAAAFIMTSILLTIMAGQHRQVRSITDDIKPNAAPVSLDSKIAPAQSTPATPAVPLSK